MAGHPYQAVLDVGEPVIVHGYRDGMGFMIVAEVTDVLGRDWPASPDVVARAIEALEADAARPVEQWCARCGSPVDGRRDGCGLCGRWQESRRKIRALRLSAEAGAVWARGQGLNVNLNAEGEGR